MTERTLMGEDMDFDDLVEEPAAPAGRQIGKPAPTQPAPAPTTPGPADEDEGDLSFDGDEALEEARKKAREARDFREKDSGHVSFQTFSFNTSQLKIDTNELWDTGENKPEAKTPKTPKTPKKTKKAKKAKGVESEAQDDFFADLAQDVISSDTDERKEKENRETARKLASSDSAPQFKISGSRRIPRPTEKFEKAATNVSSSTKKRVAGIAAVLAVGACVFFFPVDMLSTSYDWHLKRRAAISKAKVRKQCLVEYTTDPSLRSCKLFKQQVLGDDKVSGLREQFVWHKQVINTKLMPDSIKYTPPYVFIYSPDGKTVLGGSRAAGGLSADDFRAMLLEAQTKAGR
jgi:hypothetical protein